MKPKVCLTFTLLLLSFSIGFGQLGFQYQAVARTDAGVLLDNQSMDMRLSIHQGTPTGTLIWQETHAIITNSMGMFDLVVGTGTRTGGSATVFTDIDWGSGNFYLKVEANPDASWLDMGTSELLSVPYALNAKTVGSLKNLDVSEAINNHPDSALFEVKNKDGNTVFAVYNEGVRVNVSDPAGSGKGSKGGFAIGGFDAAKGIHPYEFMRVTPDSVRIYVDTAGVKRSKGGFAIGGIDAAKGTSDNFLHLTPDNYFIGHNAGRLITTGLYNSFIGYNAGVNTTDGSSNVFIGHESGLENLTGNWNVFIGNNTGRDNTFGSSNIMIGDEAGISNTEGNGNVMMGDWAGYSNTDGSGNVLIGIDAGFSNTTGDNNAFIGPYTGTANTIGNYNVFMGVYAGEDNEDGNSNTYIGSGSGWSNVSGSENVFIGLLTGSDNTGNNNTFVGSYAGETNEFGENNVFIGYGAGRYETGSGKLYIDNDSLPGNPLVYGEFSPTDPYLNIIAYTDVSGDMVVTGDIDLTGTVTEISDKRLKTDVTEYENAMDQVLKLRGVTFNWIKDESRRLDPNESQIGLLAQEVEEVIPELVKTGQDGFKSVSYSKLSVVLLEALKEQQAVIEALEQRIKVLENK